MLTPLHSHTPITHHIARPQVVLSGGLAADPAPRATLSAVIPDVWTQPLDVFTLELVVSDPL